ncbi:MAG: hypothetical protein EON52_19190, partial [Actinomycetales bacterium]
MALVTTSSTAASSPSVQRPNDSPTSLFRSTPRSCHGEPAGRRDPGRSSAGSAAEDRADERGERVRLGRRGGSSRGPDRSRRRSGGGAALRSLARGPMGRPADRVGHLPRGLGLGRRGRRGRSRRRWFRT